MNTDHRTALLNLLAKLSFKLGDFVLTSGQHSDYYIDCRTTTLHAEGGRLTGLLLYNLIREYAPHVEAVGGLTMGADPVVSNTASASAWDALSRPGTEPIHGFLIRKTTKAHGAGRRIEGFLKPGAQVAIVDDACSTGGSTVNAIEAAQEAGMIVAGVFCIVDREQGGRAAIEAAVPGVPFHSIFTANDVRAAHIALHNPEQQGA